MPAEPFAIYRLRHDANGSAWMKDHIPPNGIFHLQGFRFACDEGLSYKAYRLEMPAAEAL
jgi:hypothetical protein